MGGGCGDDDDGGVRVAVAVTGCDGAWLVVVVFASAVGGAEALSASLNDLDFATLNFNGQSTEVKALPDIINDDGDFIDDDDDVPHDLADSHDEVLANADDYDEVATVCEAEKPTCDAAGEATGMDARRGCVKKPRTSHPRKPWKIMARGRSRLSGTIRKLIFISGRIMRDGVTILASCITLTLRSHMSSPRWTVAVVVRDFYKKFYNSLGSVPNHCSVV
ncbi:hypothetical protein Tco_1367791 [Tanacetum coccineum]